MIPENIIYIFFNYKIAKCNFIIQIKLRVVLEKLVQSDNLIKQTIPDFENRKNSIWLAHKIRIIIFYFNKMAKFQYQSQLIKLIRFLQSQTWCAGLYKYNSD